MFTGFRLSLGIAWLVIVASEMLTGTPGVGGFLWQEYNSLIYAHILLAILTIGVVGFVLDRLMGHGRSAAAGTILIDGIHRGVEGVCKEFVTSGRAAREVLSDVSLSVERGEFVSIVGMMGCGKSTLLKIVAGLIAPDAGRVAIGGEVGPRRAAERGDRVSELFAAAVVFGARERPAGGRRGVSRLAKRQQREQADAAPRSGRPRQGARSGGRASCPAACVSASRLPARLRSSRRFCFSTSRSARSTR